MTDALPHEVLHRFGATLDEDEFWDVFEAVMDDGNAEVFGGGRYEDDVLFAVANSFDYDSYLEQVFLGFPRNELFRSMFVSEEGNLVSNVELMLLEHHVDDAFTGCIDFVAKVGEMPSRHVMVAGLQLPLPLPFEDVRELYKRLDASALGVDGVEGTVQDRKLRLSREALVSKPDEDPVEGRCVLPDDLASFNFPEKLAEIHHRMCPTAARVVVEPYKLIVYGPGDFFTMHVDTMYRKEQFGTISMLLPIQSPSDPAEKEQRESDKSKLTKMFHYERCIDSSQEGGGLRIYPARHIVTEDDETKLDALFEPEGDSATATTYEKMRIGRHGYMRPRSHTEQRIVSLSSKESINVSRPPSDGDATHKLRFAVWLGDVPHEVTRVESGFRVVVTYQLFKEGHVPLDTFSSPFLQLEADLKRILSIPRPSNSELPDHPFLKKAGLNRNFGVALRHLYPPAGLTPSQLKGVDAMVYHVLNRLRPCYLFSEDYPGSPWRAAAFRNTPQTRFIFPTTKSREQLLAGLDDPSITSIDDGDCLTAFMKSGMPMVTPCPWMELGMGTCIGGGLSYGNADCRANWWYRRAFLLSIDGPSLWERRRGIFVLGYYGSPAMQYMFSVEDVVREVVSYL